MKKSSHRTQRFNEGMWRLSKVFRDTKWSSLNRSAAPLVRCVRNESSSSQEDVKAEVPYKTLQVISLKSRIKAYTKDLNDIFQSQC